MAKIKKSYQTLGTLIRQPSQRLLFIGLVAIIVVILATSFTLTSLDNYRQQSRLAAEDVQIKAGLLVAVHEQWLLEMENLMKAMVTMLERQRSPQQSCQHLLPEYVNISPGIDSVILLDATGQLLCSTTPTPFARNFSDQPYFKLVLQEKRFVVGHYLQSRISKQGILPLAMPVLDERGNVRLVLVAGRSLDWLEFTLSRQYQWADMDVSIVDQDGIVQVRGSGGNLQVGKLYPSIVLRQSLTGSNGVVTDVLPDGGEYFIAYKRLGEHLSAMYVVATQPGERVLLPMLNIIRDNILQFIITMLIVIAALWIGLGHWVLNPLRRLADTMAHVSAGRADMRVKGMGPSKEFTSIGESFNAMLTTLEESEKRLKQLAENDPLLGIPNRRLLDETLHNEWRRMSRQGEPLSVLMIDVDLFKNYNDYYGHQAGDECLKRVSNAICHVVNRPADFVARYGGEEFVVLLPATEASGAKQIAEAIQAALKQIHIPHATSDVAEHVTLSIGISCVTPSPTEHVDSLVADADQAMYRAKKAGRNRIEYFGHD